MLFHNPDSYRLQPVGSWSHAYLLARTPQNRRSLDRNYDYNLSYGYKYYVTSLIFHNAELSKLIDLTLLYVQENRAINFARVSSLLLYGNSISAPLVVRSQDSPVLFACLFIITVAKLKMNLNDRHNFDCTLLSN